MFNNILIGAIITYSLKQDNTKDISEGGQLFFSWNKTEYLLRIFYGTNIL